MSVFAGTSFPSDGRGPRRARKQHKGMPSMTERCTQAYLEAREAIRRVQRLSPLVEEQVKRAMAARRPNSSSGLSGSSAASS